MSEKLGYSKDSTQFTGRSTAQSALARVVREMEIATFGLTQKQKDEFYNEIEKIIDIEKSKKSYDGRDMAGD
jgi:hypothetical protein